MHTHHNLAPCLICVVICLNFTICFYIILPSIITPVSNMESGLQQGHKRLSNEHFYQTGTLWCSPFPGDQNSLECVLQSEQSRKQLIETLFYRHTVIITSYPTNGHYAMALVQLCKSQVMPRHSRYRATKSPWAGASWTFWCLATEPVVLMNICWMSKWLPYGEYRPVQG